jgi:hypothetical protein
MSVCSAAMTAASAPVSGPLFSLPLQLGALSLGTTGLTSSGFCGPSLGGADLDSQAPLGLAPWGLPAATLQPALQLGGGAAGALQPGLIDPQLQLRLQLGSAAAGGSYASGPAPGVLQPLYALAGGAAPLPGLLQGSGAPHAGTCLAINWGSA